MMKTPEEIKKGLGDLNQKLLQGFVDNSPITPEEAVELVRIAESVANYQQVSKALCGKENATLDEVLQAVVQVNAELEAVKRERDYLLKQIKETADFDCMIYPLVCRLCDAERKFAGEQCMKCRIHTADSGQHDGFHFAGVPENTEV